MVHKKVGIADSKSVLQFRSYFLDVFFGRAYEELDHPLGDLPGISGTGAITSQFINENILRSRRLFD